MQASPTMTGQAASNQFWAILPERQGVGGAARKTAPTCVFALQQFCGGLKRLIMV